MDHNSTFVDDYSVDVESLSPQAAGYLYQSNIPVMNDRLSNIPDTTQKANNILTFIVAVLLILLFGYAAASKLAEFQRFITTMKAAPLPFMQVAAPLLAVFIPLIEFVIVGMLLTDKWRWQGLAASFFLLLVFEIYIGGMLFSGLELPCSCGGVISKLSWKEHMFFNFGFMIIAMIPYCYHLFIINNPKNIRRGVYK